MTEDGRTNSRMSLENGGSCWCHWMWSEEPNMFSFKELEPYFYVEARRRSHGLQTRECYHSTPWKNGPESWLSPAMPSQLKHPSFTHPVTESWSKLVLPLQAPTSFMLMRKAPANVSQSWCLHEFYHKFRLQVQLQTPQGSVVRVSWSMVAAPFEAHEATFLDFSSIFPLGLSLPLMSLYLWRHGRFLLLLLLLFFAWHPYNNCSSHIFVLHDTT